MGIPITPIDAAPSYEEHLDFHPVNQNPPPSSSKTYVPISRTDPDHDHDNEQGTRSYPLKRLDEPDHVHCAFCDEREIKRAEQSNMRVCCALVAVVFMLIFILCFIIAVVAMRRFGGS